MGESERAPGWRGRAKEGERKKNGRRRVREWERESEREREWDRQHYTIINGQIMIIKVMNGSRVLACSACNFCALNDWLAAAAAARLGGRNALRAPGDDCCFACCLLVCFARGRAKSECAQLRTPSSRMSRA